jgi:uncharacterized protein YjiS (DUF1127 family)
MSNHLARGSADCVVGVNTSRRPPLFPILAIKSGTIRSWVARYRQRQRLGELAELNDPLLQDIGVSQDAALREAAKWFWQK